MDHWVSGIERHRAASSGIERHRAASSGIERHRSGIEPGFSEIWRNRIGRLSFR
jgi:hypothetical protein